jgi:hypothetical protein
MKSEENRTLRVPAQRRRADVLSSEVTLGREKG